MTCQITFRQIEGELSVTVPNEQSQSALGTWYESVRDKPISDFEIDDLCKACRQHLYLDYIVPATIQRLREEPLAGELYDGELLLALRSVPIEYWLEKEDEARQLTQIAHSANETADSDVKNEIRVLLMRLSGRMGTGSTVDT